MRGFAAEPIKVVRGDSELFRRSYGPKTLENHQKSSFTVVRLLFTKNRIPPKCAGIVGRPDGTGPRSFRGVLRELGSENIEKTPKILLPFNANNRPNSVPTSWWGGASQIYKNLIRKSVRKNICWKKYFDSGYFFLKVHGKSF